MQSWLPAAAWFILVFVAPAAAQVLLGPALDAQRADGRSRHVDRRGHPVWQRQDADPRNYTQHGKKLLRVMKLLQIIQVIGFLVWGAIFII